MDNSFRKSVAVIFSILFISFFSGCASNSALKAQYDDYRYSGEKYGKVIVIQSDKVSADSKKGIRIEEMDLESRIVAELKSSDLYDDTENNTVKVLINSIYIRNAFNAIMFGFMAGADNIDGTVTIFKGDMELASFDIKASYALGGLGGGQNVSRLGWLSNKFAELTTKTILGKSDDK